MNSPAQKTGDLSLSEIVEPVCLAHGVEMVSVRLLSQAGRSVIQVVIDRERGDGSGLDGSGTTLEDCTAVSRDLSAALDVHDGVVPATYHLEVSSPGLERPLVRLRDFERFVGREAKVETRSQIHDRRRFQGTILAVEGQVVNMDQDGDAVSIQFEDISKAHLVYRF